MLLWEIVSPRDRVFSPFGRVYLPFGRAFSPLKNGLGSNISEETLVCPKKVVLVENLFIGQKAELSPLNGRGRYSRRQFVRLLHNFMHPILSRPRWNGASASATGDTSKKNQSDAALAIWKYVPGAHEITDAKRLDQSVSPHYFGSNDDGSVCLLWWKEAPAPVWKQDRIQQNKL